MRKLHIISFALTLAILFSFVCMPQYAFAAESTDDIVLAKAEDFSVRFFPAVEPTEARINKYNGDDKKIVIPDTIDGLPVTRIGAAAFKDNEKLEYIKLPATIDYISAKAFEHCSSLTWIDMDSENPYFTSEKGILFNKDKTTLVSFPVGRSGYYAIPESVVSIGDYAFYTCQYLTRIAMHNKVESVGDYSFAFCFGLLSVKFSDNLSIIGKEAFYGCVGLKEIHLPYSLTSIGQNAFLGGIDSDSNYYYYFNQGIYYVKGTYSEEYAKSLHLPKGCAIAEYRTVSTPTVTLIDTYGILPEEGAVELISTPLDPEVYMGFMPIRYSEFYVFNITLKVDGKTFTPSKPVVLNFSSINPDAVGSATKVYSLDGNTATELFRQPYAPFVGAQVSSLGKYMVAINNDFSLPGDVDGDNSVTTDDTRIALCIVADLMPYIAPEQIICANLDDSDDIITTVDALKILRRAAGIE